LFDPAWAGTGRFHWKHDAFGGNLKNNIRAEQMKGSEGQLGQDAPDLGTLLAYCRSNLSGDKYLGQRKFHKRPDGVKVEVTAETAMGRHYHKITAEMLDAEDAPEATEDSTVVGMLKVHHWVPTRAGQGRHRRLLCGCDACISMDYDLCELADDPNFALSAPHDVAPVTGSAAVTRAEAEAQLAEGLADKGLNASEELTIGSAISIEDNSPDAPVPFHILDIVTLPYTLTADQLSPVLQHGDGEPLPMSAGDRVVDAVFYQPVGETGLRFERWDAQWLSKGRFQKTFEKWAGCPIVVVPLTLIRHFGFSLQREKKVTKSGPRFCLSQVEDDNIRASLNSL
jgi:hypothetical protein